MSSDRRVVTEEFHRAVVKDQRDYYWKKAKREGYRSRAAYKLLEIQQRFRIFRKGDTVLDLGCAPGGWLQVIAAAVGPAGKVVGVDRVRTPPLPLDHVVLIQGDIADPEVQEAIRKALGKGARAVTSDLSPSLTGVSFQDHCRSCELVRQALGVARVVLLDGGSFLAKAFEGEELGAIEGELKRDFRHARRIVPSASRKASSEIYLLGRGFRAGRKR